MLLDDMVVLFPPSKEDISEALEKATATSFTSPFSALEKWMEFLGPPPHPSWVRVKGILLHAWNVEVFKLQGNCVGCVVEVDRRTRMKEDLKIGRLKVILDRSQSFLLSISLLVGDFKFFI